MPTLIPSALGLRASRHRRAWTGALAGGPLVLAVSALAAAQAPSPSADPVAPAPEASAAASCGSLPLAPSAAPDGTADQPDITVFAAASLTDAFEALQAPWNAAHPGSELILSFDASSTLRAQIEEGAPADILASADTANAEALVDACLAPGPVTPFAGNRLVVVVPAGNPAALESPTDLARSGVRVVAAGPDVPITRYTSLVIENLATLPGYPADFAAAVAANMVSEEDNVRAVLAKIELGEGDAAIVYATDAASSDDVKTIAIPDEANVPATYAAVRVADSSRPALAVAFLEFLLGPEARAILVERGFLPAPSNGG